MKPTSDRIIKIEGAKVRIAENILSCLSSGSPGLDHLSHQIFKEPSGTEQKIWQ